MMWFRQKQISIISWLDRTLAQLVSYLIGCPLGRLLGRSLSRLLGYASSRLRAVGIELVAESTTKEAAKQSTARQSAAKQHLMRQEADPAIEEQVFWQVRSQGLWDIPGARESNYWTECTAPAETLWQMVSDLADIASWHPLITSTNAPRGQRATPGLIYRAVSRYFPLSTQVFVERVLPGELLSIRLFPFPGLQERVTYRIVSTLCGTCVLYSMTLSGWLSPLAWPMMKPQAPRVAVALVRAAEAASLHPNASARGLYRSPYKTDADDIF
ncbi:MAG: SRPBCC family protein [Phormidesmis sp.]